MNELNMRELTEEDRKRNTEVRAKLGIKTGNKNSRLKEIHTSISEANINTKYAENKNENNLNFKKNDINSGT